MRRWGWAILSILLILSKTSALAQATYTRGFERVASMDPAEAMSAYAARVVQLTYETLLEYDYTARPYRVIPGLAESLPEVRENGRVLIFKIHPDARFHPDPCFSNPQGRAVTAADVVYSLKRLGDRKVASPGAWTVEDAILGMRTFAEISAGAGLTDYTREIAGLRVLDERTLRIELAKPTHVFLYYLTTAYTAVIPQEAVEFYGADFGSRTAGSGPYRLSQWRRNHQMTFERVPAWRGWQQGPAAIMPGDGVPFDRLAYRTIDDVSTQWLCFLRGELDFLGEIARDNWDVVIDASGKLNAALQSKGIALHAMPALDVAYLGINMEDPVLGPNKALRQVLNCAVDGAAWERFYNGRVARADGPVPPGAAGRLETPFAYAFSLDKAKRLLHDAGYPGGIDPKTGRRLELTLDLGRTTQDSRESAEMLASFYAKAGIVLKPQHHNWPTFLKRISDRQSQIFLLRWMGDYPDAETFMQLFYGRNVSPGPNRTNYVNPAFDKLYDEACACTDEDARNAVWQAMQEIIREDCPWVFLHYLTAYSLCNPRVSGYAPSDFPFGTEKYLRCK